jgi:hypothetical protein
MSGAVLAPRRGAATGGQTTLIERRYRRVLSASRIPGEGLAAVYRDLETFEG